MPYRKIYSLAATGWMVTPLTIYHPVVYHTIIWKSRFFGGMLRELTVDHGKFSR